MGLSDDVKEMIRTHMGTQPYQIHCADCNAKLELCSTTVDIDDDITIEVYPCKCRGE
jgi:hypothetical protein